MISQGIKLFSGVITTSGDTKTSFIDVDGFKGGLFFLKATAKGGTSPTLDVKIITYDKKTDDWYEAVAFAQLTDVGKEMKTVTDVGKRLAILYTLGGTGSPTFTFTVSAILKNV